jgi:hypothetical protein
MVEDKATALGMQHYLALFPPSVLVIECTTVRILK